MPTTYPRVARLNTPEKFQDHLDALGVYLPFDQVVEPKPDGPLAQPLALKSGRVIGNRFAIHHHRSARFITRRFDSQDLRHQVMLNFPLSSRLLVNCNGYSAVDLVLS